MQSSSQSHALLLQATGFDLNGKNELELEMLLAQSLPSESRTSRGM
jgi:hypothetical protein